MQCEACRERLGALLEASLTEPERSAIEQHLEACSDCRLVRAELEALDRLLACVPAEEPVPPALTARILDAARRPQRSAAIGTAAAPAARPLPLRPLVWATAAAVLITAVISWILVRPDGGGGDRLPLPPPGPRSVSARLHVNRTVGRLPADVTCRVYGPSVGRLFADLSVLEVTPALSWNNLRIIREAPFREVTADAAGRFRLTEPLGTGAHLAYITRTGYLGAWGLIEPTAEGDAPDIEAVLFPATTIEVSGTVRDAASGLPLAGAVIASPDGTGSTLSDAAGNFRGTIAGVPGRRIRIYALATDHAAARAILPAAARRRGAFHFDASLPPAERHDLALTVVDAAGEPVSGAQVLAVPDRDAPERPHLPALRRDLPEVGVSDGQGRVVLTQLLACRYRLEVRHPRLELTRERYADPRHGDAVRLQVRPAGDARVRVTVRDAAGKTRAGARVVLIRLGKDGDRSRPIQLHERPSDLQGRVEFTDLPPGRAVLQVFTGDGAGRYLTIEIERGDVVPVDYRLTPAPWRIRGTLSAEDRNRYRVVRLQGDRPRMQAGRHRSVSHYLAVEVPVDESGRFVFPPLPQLGNAELLGRRSADPGQPPDPLHCEPSLKEVFQESGKGERTIRATRPR